jgi:hypothetical protein
MNRDLDSASNDRPTGFHDRPAIVTADSFTSSDGTPESSPHSSADTPQSPIPRHYIRATDGDTGDFSSEEDTDDQDNTDYGSVYDYGDLSIDIADDGYLPEDIDTPVVETYDLNAFEFESDPAFAPLPAYTSQNRNPIPQEPSSFGYLVGGNTRSPVRTPVPPPGTAGYRAHRRTSSTEALVGLALESSTDSQWVNPTYISPPQRPLFDGTSRSHPLSQSISHTSGLAENDQFGRRRGLVNAPTSLFDFAARQRERMSSNFVDLTDSSPATSTPIQSAQKRRREGSDDNNRDGKTRRLSGDASRRRNEVDTDATDGGLEFEEIDLRDIEDDEQVKSLTAELVKSQQKDNTDTFSTIQCVICMDNPTNLTVTPCGEYHSLLLPCPL